MRINLFRKPLQFIIPLIILSITLSCLSFGSFPPNPVDEYKSPNEVLVTEPVYGSDGYIFLEDYSDTDPAWSPDGKYIAFSSNRDGDYDIYIMEADGSNLFNATADPSPLLTSILYMIKKSGDRWPSWSPDGSKIVFSSAQDNIMMQSIELNIFSMKVEGTEVINLTDTLDVDGIPDWAPDGNQIVFVSDRDPDTNIYLMDSDGTNVIQLTDIECDNDFPKWSPDGNRIAFESNRDGNHDIYLMNNDGSEIIRLTSESSEDQQPSWSPRGDQIAFSSDRDGDYEIYIMDADGSNITQVTNNEINDLDPAWSPDGNKIAFRSNLDEGWRINIIDVDGSNLLQLTGGPVEVPATENSVFHLNKGISHLYRYVSSGEGSIEQAIEALNESISLNETLAEAYLARGLAYLLRCEFSWAHLHLSEVKVFERNDNCPDYNRAIADLETAIKLGLAPGVEPGAANLLEKLK